MTAAPQHLKNRSNGQYNFAPPCAMLTLENFRMRRANKSVWGQPLTSWLSDNQALRSCPLHPASSFQNLIGAKVRIEFALTHSKQRIGFSSTSILIRGGLRERPLNNLQRSASSKIIRRVE